jgi:hypothetical protein
LGWDDNKSFRKNSDSSLVSDFKKLCDTTKTACLINLGRSCRIKVAGIHHHFLFFQAAVS